MSQMRDVSAQKHKYVLDVNSWAKMLCIFLCTTLSMLLFDIYVIWASHTPICIQISQSSRIHSNISRNLTCVIQIQAYLSRRTWVAYSRLFLVRCMKYHARGLNLKYWFFQKLENLLVDFMSWASYPCVLHPSNWALNTLLSTLLLLKTIIIIVEVLYCDPCAVRDLTMFIVWEYSVFS